MMKRTTSVLLVRSAIAFGVLVAEGGCKSAGDDLGPLESYVLFAPVPKKTVGAANAPVVHKLSIGEEPALTLGRYLNDGFVGEMVRTVYLAKLIVRDTRPDGLHASDELRAAAQSPLCLVVGADDGAGLPVGHGLGFERTFGQPVEKATLPWLGLSGNVEGDKALVQSLAGRLAQHAAAWIAMGGRAGTPPLLVDAYRMAMEVIAREWRAGSGPDGILRSTAGTMEQRRLFANVRENEAILDETGHELRAAAALLGDPHVAATVLYRLAQSKTLARTAGPAAIYAPLVSNELPLGVNPALVLGPIRNFHAKVLTAWAHAIGAGHPPADIVDLLDAYGALFPSEKAEATRIFVTTTFGGTVVAGGFSRAPADIDATLAKLGALTDDVMAGRHGLRDAVGK